MNVVQELQNWFISQCNGEWEHKLAIEIQSCDNPGWWVKIDLKDTALENREFKIISKNVSQKLIDQAMGRVRPPFAAESPIVSNDWMLCYVQDGKFDGAGDSSKLEEILSIFLSWTKK